MLRTRAMALPAVNGDESETSDRSARESQYEAHGKETITFVRTLGNGIPEFQGFLGGFLGGCLAEVVS